MTIRSKILFTFLAAFLATMALITGLAYQLCSTALETMVAARLQRLAREFLSLADQRVGESQNTLEAWSHRSDIPPQIIVGDVDAVVADSLRDLTTHGRFAGPLECADRQGKVIAATDPGMIGRMRIGEDWFQAGLRGEAFAGPLQPGRPGGAPVLRIAEPIWMDADEPAPKEGARPPGAGPRPPAARRVVGVVTGQIDWETVLHLVESFEEDEAAGGFRSTTLRLADRDGLVLAAHRRQGVLEENLQHMLGLSPTELSSAIRPFQIVVNRQTGARSVCVLVRAHGTGLIASRRWLAAAELSTEEAFAPSRTLLVWVSLLALFTTGVLGTAGAIVLGRMVAPIQRFVAFAEQLGRGELDEVLEVPGTDDLAALGRALNRMRANLVARTEELKKRASDLEFQDWCKAQINRLSNTLQGLSDLSAAARTVIGELPPMMSAVQGAFYVRESLIRKDGDPAILELMGGYALTDRSRVSRFRIGDGLVGQCAAEQRQIALDEVPTEYFLVESGLGALTPSSLVVVPVVSKGELIGVLELAALTRFPPARLAFLDSLMPTLGIVLENIAARVRTEALLAESRELTARLREQSEALAQSSRYKSEFLANMSHELRTPLNSLLILSGLLVKNRSGNLSVQEVDYARTIRSAGTDLLGLIDDILDLSKIEAGRMTLTVGAVSFGELQAELAASFEPFAQDRKVAFAISLQDGLPPTIFTDHQRLFQILKNLLSNAFKFTSQGRVTLTIGPAPDGGSPRADLVFFAVEDTGIGIEREKLKLIFDAFQQADGTTSRRYGGTGLGLSISRELARILRGRIEVESDVGHGSRFTLWLPRALEVPEEHREARGGGGDARATGTEASRPGPVSSVAGEAPAAVADGADGAVPRGDVVFVPRSDAWRLSEQGSPPAPVPLGSPQGSDPGLTRPAAPVPARKASASSPAMDELPTEPDIAGRTILLVDDDERNLFALGEILQAEGVRVLTARDGHECLARLAEHPGVDLILMDVMMPGMDGHDCTRRIRLLPEFRDVPIVAVTAKAMLGDREEVLEAGASDCLTKPVQAELLLRVVGKWLARAAAARGRAPADGVG